MKRFIVSGWGRRVGAIGIRHSFCRTIDAENEEDAKLRIYDYFEHISGMRVVEDAPTPATTED